MSNRCEVCGRNKGETSAIVKGRYGIYCPECLARENRQAGSHKAGYDRDREREDYRKDMLQPRLPNGKINVDFAKAYPDIAKDEFTEEELKSV